MIPSGKLHPFSYYCVHFLNVWVLHQFSATIEQWIVVLKCLSTAHVEQPTTQLYVFETDWERFDTTDSKLV